MKERKWSEKEQRILQVVGRSQEEGVTQREIVRRAKANSEEIEGLVREGYLQTFQLPRKRKVRYRLTKKGEEVFKKLREAPPRGDSQEMALIKELIKKVEKISSQVEEISDSLERLLKRLQKKADSKGEFTQVLYQAYQQIKNREGNDLVPIPRLWKELSSQVDEKTFREKLLELERRRVLDLQCASDKFLIGCQTDGVWREPRGLIYYVVWREVG